MRQANRRGALVTLILGDDELSRGEVTVKSMREGGEQKAVSFADFLGAVQAEL
jgi:histidyl-tRNA synthetase